MYDERIDHILDEVIAAEGGYVNHPSDKGGPTKYGITSNTLSRWRKMPIDTAEMAVLTIKEAKEIYYSEYIKRYKLDLIKNNLLLLLMFDTIVLYGPKGIKWLQEAVGATPDGFIGPNTVSRIDERPASAIVSAVVKRRIKYSIKIVKENRTQFIFLDGWISRALEYV